MIGAIHPLGCGFKGPVLYAEVGRTGSRRNRVAWAETYNLPTRDLELAACFMGATANGSVSGTRTPVYFFSVSFDVDDPVDEAMMRRVARRTLRDMGLEEHEAVVVAHKDRSHPHLHFIVNRVHPTRFVLWRKWWDYARLERSLRAQEVELGLRVVPGRHAPVPSLDRAREGHTEGWQRGARWIKPLPGPKRGDRAFLQHVTERAAPILRQVRSWAALESGLAEQGLALTVKGGGFRITDGKHHVKASEVGRAFSRYHLEKRLGGYPDYRARMAVADIGPVRRSERIVVAPPPVRPRRIPQFGDAGYGINELFGPAPARGAERPGVGVEPELAATPVRGNARFLRQVRAQAGPVLTHANNWEELERGLARLGLTLRAKGGGFVLTDGAQEVKASDVGRAFSGSRLKERLDRRPEGAAPAIEPAAPAAPVVLPATPTLPEESAAQPVAATAGHTDLDEQHQPIRSARTPQFGDAGHGIDELFGYVPAREREQPAPALEHAPVPQLGHAEAQVPAPEEFADEHAPAREDHAGPINEMDLDTSAASTTAALALVGTPEPNQTAEPDREEVAAPALTDHPVTANKVEVKRARGPQRRRMQRKRIVRREQIELWFEVLAPSEPAAAAPADRDVAQDQPAPAREEIPEAVPGTPLPSVAPESSLPLEQVSAPEPPQMPAPAGENVPATASADHDHSTQTELSARIERLRQKASPSSAGKWSGTTPTAEDKLPGEPAATQDRSPSLRRSGESARDLVGDRGALVGRPGSAEAEAFLQMANRALEGKARSRELREAETEAIAARNRRSDLDKTEAHVKTTRSDFKAQLDRTMRDPGAFLSWFDRLSEQRKREMLRMLISDRASFAREFAAALASGAAQATRRQDLFDTIKTTAAEFFASSNPEKRVFVNPEGEGEFRLAAHRGEYYLDIERGCEAAFRKAREFLGLPESATRNEVRKAASDHAASAKRREADALFRKSRLGETPSVFELPRALRKLSLSDQEWVVKRLPAMPEHIKLVAQAGIDLAEGPQRKGNGYGI